MELLLVLGLVSIGLILVLIEALFVPGSTWLGILGCLTSLLGIVVAYNCFGGFIGTLTLAATSMAGAVTVYYSFKTKTWNKWALNHRIDGKAQNISVLTSQMSVGDVGRTLSALRPMGTVDFGQFQLEVRTTSHYVESGRLVHVTKIEGTKIYVEPF